MGDVIGHTMVTVAEYIQHLLLLFPYTVCIWHMWSLQNSPVLAMGAVIFC